MCMPSAADSPTAPSPCFQVSARNGRSTKQCMPRNEERCLCTLHSSTCLPPSGTPQPLTKDTSSRMRPKVAARSVRSSLTCLETSSRCVMSSPASKRAWFGGGRSGAEEVRSDQWEGRRGPGSCQPHGEPPHPTGCPVPWRGAVRRLRALTTTDLRISVVMDGSTRSS